MRTRRSRVDEQNVFTGERVSSLVHCANYTQHVINVNTGEDVSMKIISFIQQGPCSICILSAVGVISSVTIRRVDPSGGTLTFEGQFDIGSLTGSFLQSDTGGNVSGGMSVILAKPDGRFIAGIVAGHLVAASPVQIFVGSFLAVNEHETTSPSA